MNPEVEYVRTLARMIDSGLTDEQIKGMVPQVTDNDLELGRWFRDHIDLDEGLVPGLKNPSIPDMVDSLKYIVEYKNNLN